MKLKIFLTLAVFLSLFGAFAPAFADETANERAKIIEIDKNSQSAKKVNWRAYMRSLESEIKKIGESAL